MNGGRVFLGISREFPFLSEKTNSMNLRKLGLYYRELLLCKDVTAKYWGLYMYKRI